MAARAARAAGVPLRAGAQVFASLRKGVSSWPRTSLPSPLMSFSTTGIGSRGVFAIHRRTLVATAPARGIVDDIAENDVASAEVDEEVEDEHSADIREERRTGASDNHCIGSQFDSDGNPISYQIVPLFERPVFPGTKIVVEIKDKAYAEAIEKSLKDSSTSNFAAFKTKSNLPQRSGEEAPALRADDLHDVGVLVEVRLLRNAHPHDEEVLPDKLRSARSHKFDISLTGVERVKRGTTSSSESGLLSCEIEPFETDDCVVSAPSEPSYQTVRSQTIALGALSVFVGLSYTTQRAPEPALSTLSLVWQTSPKGNPYDRYGQSYMQELGSHLFNPTLACDSAAYFCRRADGDRLQEVLATRSLIERLDLVLELLNADLISLRAWKVAHEDMLEEITRFVKIQGLRRLSEEGEEALGDDVDCKSEKLLEGKVLPAEANEVTQTELQRLRGLKSNPTEKAHVEKYLETLCSLPWGIYSQDVLDISTARQILDQDHFGMKDTKNRILEFLAVAAMKGELSGRIMVLVGPPGVGKTSIGASVAKAVGREFRRIAVGGSNDASDIRGFRRTYVGSTPGKIVTNLKECGTMNPVLMLDEIDKLGMMGLQGDIGAALLEVLDPSQNHAFVDQYLEVPLDLSKVFFICTANDLSTISGPLLDRMDVVHVTGYVEDHKMQIVHRYLLPKAMQEANMKPDQLILDDDTLRALIRGHCRESGVRSIEKKLRRIVGKAALLLYRDKVEQVTVDAQNLADFVGHAPFTDDKRYRVPVPGVVSGLAWSSLGGSSLWIETNALPVKTGGGTYKVTGHIGDVMSESVDIAVTYAKRFLQALQSELEIAHNPNSEQDKANAVVSEQDKDKDKKESKDDDDADDVEKDFFSCHRLHIHIPDGAVSKDGPSAGIALTTALLSLAMDKAVVPDLAMTGEISLKGYVLPVGGLQEKFMAAKRAGVKTLIVPEACIGDIKELDAIVVEGLEIYPVSGYRQVYDIAFGMPEGKEVMRYEHPIDESFNDLWTSALDKKESVAVVPQ